MPVAELQHDRDTREAILSAAVRLFGERGFANVSIRDICEIAGVTPPTIYHYFGNKDQLFQEVIRSKLSLQGFQQTLQELLRSQPDPVTRLCTFIQFYLTSFPRDFFNPGMFLQETTQIYGMSYERVAGEMKAIEEIAEQIIRSGISQKVFRPVDLRQMTLFLMNSLMAFVLGEVHYNQRFDPQESASFFQDLLLQGLLSNQPATG